MAKVFGLAYRIFVCVLGHVIHHAVRYRRHHLVEEAAGAKIFEGASRRGGAERERWDRVNEEVILVSILATKWPAWRSLINAGDQE
ncbi:MAG TPA: hypothetical protein VME69_04620 [Methylocella sp.]|nr:hypothetical protein [Methylocella sp.]